MTDNETFEQSMSRLEDVVSLLEAGELPLDQAISRYKDGVELVQRCRTQLEQAELLVRKLVEGEGTPALEPVDLFGGRT